MADVFVSYAREDYRKVVPFVAILEAQGWSVWWDKEISPGLSFSKVIEKELAQVSCVVVFWSRHAVSSDWVHAEASEGMERNILVPILLEDVKLPLVFRQKQSANFFGWPRNADQEQIQQVLSAISEAIDKPAPVAAPASRSQRSSYVILLLALFVVAGLTFYSYYPTSTPATVAESRPGNTITYLTVHQFQNMENDVAQEVADYLTLLNDVQVVSESAGNSGRPTRGYSLQAIQTGRKLLVSLFDNAEQRTQLEFAVDIDQTPLNAAARMIADRIAETLGKPLGFRQEVVTNELYLEYLEAREVLRLPRTEANVSRAIELFSDVAGQAPRFGEAQGGLCHAYIASYRIKGGPSDFENAEKHCFRAIRLSDNNPLIEAATAELYRTSGQLAEASQHFENALRISPYLTEALRGLALVRIKENNFDEGVSLFRRAQQYEPGNWRNYYKLAEEYFRTGRYAEAVTEWNIAKAFVEDKSLVTSDLGAAYFMLGDFENAVENWEVSLTLKPGFAAMSNLGSAYYFRGDYQRALEIYKQAIEINQSDYRMWMNAGEAALHSGVDPASYYRQSVLLGEQQLQINPDDAEIVSAMAQSHAALGDSARALQLINQSLLLGSGNVYVLYDVAVAYSRLGNLEAMNATLKQMKNNGYSAVLIEKDANFKQ